MAQDSPLVLTLGDSWVGNGSSQTWARQLVDSSGGDSHNYAKVGSKSGQLLVQVEKFFASNPGRHVDAVIVHVGGNNLLENLENLATMAEEEDGIACKVCQDIKACIENLREKGVNLFLVSDVPFSVRVPFIKSAIETYAEKKGLEFVEAQSLAKRLETELNQKIQDLSQQFPEMKVIHFQEVKELEKWNEEDLFDEDGLHPNQKGHAKLKDAVPESWKLECFPERSADSAQALPSSTQTCGVQLTPQKTERPSKRPLVDIGSGSLQEQFDNIEKEVAKMKEEQKLSLKDLADFYGLYKQAKEGDNNREKPQRGWNLLKFQLEYAKWKAWEERRGMTKDDAMTQYVAKYRDVCGGLTKDDAPQNMSLGGADRKRSRHA